MRHEPTQPSFGIIVPCFNDDRYVAACIESIVTQEYEGEIFIEIVDDGSSDKTWSIVSEYARLFGQIRLSQVVHSGSPSRARNVALSRCRADYVIFLDADDRLAPGALNAFSTAIQANGAEVVAGRKLIFEEHTHRIFSSPDTGWKEGWRRLSVTESMRRQPVCRNASGKAFQLDTINANGLRFPEGHISEDTAFMLALSQLVDRARLIENDVAIVTHRDARYSKSITQKTDSRAILARLSAARACRKTFLDRGWSRELANMDAVWALGISARCVRSYAGLGQNKAAAADAVREFLAACLSSRNRVSMRITLRLGCMFAWGVMRLPSLWPVFHWVLKFVRRG